MPTGHEEIAVYIDPDLPEGTAQFEDSKGNVLGKIINIGSLH